MTLEPLGAEIRQRVAPSLCLTTPIFLATLLTNILVAMLAASRRASRIDLAIQLACVLLMSVSSLIFIIGGQYLFAKILRLVPVSGFLSGVDMGKFLLLPVGIGVLSGLGSGIRLYRTFFLEETGKDYVRTARAKGLSETNVLFRHVLKNAMIPILANVPMQILMLFMGNLLLESFFSIPGRRIHDHGHQHSGLRHCPGHGIPRLCPLHGRTAADRYLLRRSRPPHSIPIAVLQTNHTILPCPMPATLFQSWWFQNLFTLSLLAGAALLAWRLSRREYWRNAFHEICRNRLAVISFVILCGYGAIAVLDSIGWRRPLRHPETGEIARHPETGKVILDQGASALDYLLAPISAKREKTYSAPLATTDYTPTTAMSPTGQPQRVHAPLAYPRSHLLGTDRIGQDVFCQACKSIRTGIIIGLLTTILAVPFALIFGTAAGYYGGWIDDATQYVCTVLSSIPTVLFIAAFMIIFGQGLPQLARPWASPLDGLVPTPARRDHPPA